jgi:hypothetical protein
MNHGIHYTFPTSFNCFEVTKQKRMKATALSLCCVLSYIVVRRISAAFVLQRLLIARTKVT